MQWWTVSKTAQRSSKVRVENWFQQKWLWGIISLKSCFLWLYFMVVNSSSSGVELYRLKSLFQQSEIWLTNRASSLDLPLMETFPYFNLSLFILEPKGLNKTGLCSGLTHPASELQALSWLSGLRAVFFSRKVLEWHTLSHCKPEKFCCLAYGKDSFSQFKILRLCKFFLSFPGATPLSFSIALSNETFCGKWNVLYYTW